MMETTVAAFMDNLNISRKKSTILTVFIIGLISIPATLSFGVLKDFKLWDKTIFDFLDYTTSNLFLPFNTLIICLIAGWCIPYFWEKAFGKGFIGSIFNILLKFIVPFILICVLVSGI